MINSDAMLLVMLWAIGSTALIADILIKERNDKMFTKYTIKLKSKIQDEKFELGEVVDATISTYKGKIEIDIIPKTGICTRVCYKSLAELFEHWEDVSKEEPKEFWCVTMYGGVVRVNEDDEPLIPYLKEIGNYFNDKESTYDALDKLKALKRLEEKGFKFDGYDVANRGGDDMICGQVYFKGSKYGREEIEDDLFLLFGGEE